MTLPCGCLLIAMWVSADCPCADYQVVQRPGKLWMIFLSTVTFANARARCLQEGAELVSVSSPEENAALVSAARSAGVWAGGNHLTFWIGLVSKTGLRTTNKTEWMWLSTGQTPTFDGWSKAGGQYGARPDNYMNQQGLTAIVHSDGSWGK